MNKHYDFISSQDKGVKRGREKNVYHSVPDKRDVYSIVIPPPNVTDILHLGHALNNTVQDILVRYYRNTGMNAEWLPGTDHAGIATQVIVEKKLAAEGKDKDSMGRDEFIREVWKYVDNRKDTILKQLEGIGASCDWDRKKFTLDNDLSETISTVFKKLYDDGYIYKGTYIVNWCPRCHTAISDEEVDHESRKGKLFYIKYPIKDSREYIIVATTRPETMLGDTAIAVNPNDKNKKHLIGKIVILPLLDREIPIIADKHVDMEFGTGFVKVTPAHDPNDFEIGKRHGLEEILIMDNSAVINENGKQYQGLSREDARKRIIEDLEKSGLIDKIKDHENSVGTCYRCKTTIEPYLSEQWFVKMKDLAKPALEASLNGELSFYPARWKGVYDHWLKNINDWCISRQLWWGHRIPIYYCNKCSNEFVSVKNPEKCPKCDSSQIKQDDNVLDIWFSSWLWTFSTLGWLNNSEEYKYYYPTNVIVSASEILFFWISRMVIAGLHFTGKLPFKDIYIHGTVRDEKVRKMSKSLGNGIDPLEISKKYGVDALRFSLIYLSGQGNDPSINKSTFELGRNFANKIWNAVRFITMKTDNLKIPKNVEPKDIFDIWILNRLDEIIENAEKNLSKYRFYDYANDLYEFFWHDFCDWYLEIVKVRKSGFDIALFIINRFMAILNPIMPFISEEINELLGNEKLIHEKVIEKTGLKLHNTENEINIFKSAVTAIRNLIADTGFKKIDILVNGKSVFLEKQSELIKTLCKCELITFIKEKPIKAIPSIFNEGMIFIKAKNIENIDDILQEYSKELKNINIQIDKTEKTLNNKQFLEKAKKEVIDAMKEKGKMFYDKKKRISEIIGSLK